MGENVRVVFSVTLPIGSIRGGGSEDGTGLSVNVGFICGCELVSRCRLINLVQNRIIKATQPNSAATLKRTIQTIAAGCTPRSAILVAPPNTMPNPITTVRPSTRLGMMRLIGAAGA